MKTVDEILIKYDWPIRAASDKTDLTNIEIEIGFGLPADYKDFLMRHVGHQTRIGAEYVELWDKDDLLVLNREYGIIKDLSSVVGIGSNGAGELIGIEKLIDGKLRIVLTPFVDLNRQYNIEIGSSFTDFLIRVDRGEKWFKDVGSGS